MATKISAAISFFFILFIFSASSNARSNIPRIPRIPKLPPKSFPPKNPPANPFCPRDTLKLGVCWAALGGIEAIVVGSPTGERCCSLIDGLADAEAASCLCTVIKETALGITTQWSVALSLLVSTCRKEIPDGFKCI